MHARFGLSCYKELMTTPFESVFEIGESKPIPKFSVNFLESLILEAKNVLMQEPPMQHLKGDIVIVGDIHGNFHDLMRILIKNGLPPKTRYLFLGDYVDRGQFSIDVITFLYILKVQFPKHITLLRGNHEFDSINRIYGFHSEILKRFNTPYLWTLFNDSFNYMPICAFISDSIFCVHGGISNKVNRKALEKLKYPIHENDLIDDLVWSDPTEHGICCISNKRGKGVKFGQKTLNEFFNEMNVKFLIRGHECVSGCKSHIDNKVLTIFSTSNYGDNNNKAGFARIDQNLCVECETMNALETPSLRETYFIPIIFNEEKQNTTNQPIPKIMSCMLKGFDGSKLGLLSPTRPRYNRANTILACPRMKILSPKPLQRI